MKNIVKLVRPRQWVKNFFVFLPLFFGGELFNVQNLLGAVITFFSFCFAASSIYCFNDIHDVDDDRRHSVKRNRPIASGAISIPQAYGVMIIMIIIALGLAFLLPISRRYSVLGIVAFYFALNIAYCVKLKQFAIIDVCIVSFGFVLRIVAGGAATSIVLSHWLVLMTFLLTLFLSFAKRRDDVVRLEATGEAPRKNTRRYNLTFINEAINITGAVTLVCYIMYTVSPEVVNRFHSGYLYLTSVFVLVGILRYIQITVVDKKSGDPTKVIFKDRFSQFIVTAWLISFLIIIYAS